MEVIRSCETSVSFYQSAQPHVQEYSACDNHRSESLKSDMEAVCDVRTVSKCLPSYTASHPRGQYSSKSAPAYFHQYPSHVDSSVGIATGLRAGRPGFDSRHSTNFLLHSVQSGSEAYPVSCRMGTIWRIFTEVKRPGRETGNSPSLSSKVKNGGAIPPLSHMSSQQSAQLIKPYPPHATWRFDKGKTRGKRFVQSNVQLWNRINSLVEWYKFITTYIYISSPVCSSTHVCNIEKDIVTCSGVA
jgi:hypothetical protein